MIMRIGNRFRQLLTEIEAEAATTAPALGPIKLTFDAREIEAVVMASRSLVRQGDPALAQAARTIVKRIEAATPVDAHRHIGLAPDFQNGRDEAMVVIGQCLRARKKMRLAYEDAIGKPSQRTIWPVAVAIFDQGRVLTAWCEMRDDWRHFRLDRMIEGHIVDEVIPKGRTLLLRTWRAAQANHWDRVLVT
jgi:predicted DNA-binding transcriptional regulator YafY